MKAYSALGILFILILIIGCFKPPEDIPPTEEVGEVNGIKPIYTDLESLTEYPMESPQPIVKLGKIYYKDPYIFVNESARGVHIIDNSNPLEPKKISFLKVLGNNDIAIKGNYLYADNLSDLVVFDISDISDIKFVNRVKDLYPNEDGLFLPAGYNGYFECYDEGKGALIGWENTVLNNPTCFK